MDPTITIRRFNHYWQPHKSCFARATIETPKNSWTWTPMNARHFESVSGAVRSIKSQWNDGRGWQPGTTFVVTKETYHGKPEEGKVMSEWKFVQVWVSVVEDFSKG